MIAAAPVDPRAGAAAGAPRGASASSPRVLLAVIAGGMLGTSLRFALDTALPNAPTGLAASTLLVNAVGSLALGVVAGALPARAPRWLRAGLTAGLLGSFTTFSALAVSVVLLADAGLALPAAASLALNLALGLGAAAGGILLGRAFAAPRPEAPDEPGSSSDGARALPEAEA
ncbi:CrcB family protein [Microcella daejeonensis]|uniref:fluoride efflux transporter FluC n=1 Tax=Microcella daejeonensis TaxID=2994971 RepID=UPI0022705C98|nr:CrcB family protein [Microcella daejeonensis]WAB84332.1 CrcB family protein [Microcella daejeonensis]